MNSGPVLLRKMKNRSAHAAVFRICAAIAAAAVIFFGARALYAAGFFLPRWIKWEEKEISLSEPYGAVLKLSDRTLSISDDPGIYTSPSSWKIAGAYAGDINHDGREEIILLVWKRGSYGSSRPFWIKRDETGFSEHIFIFRFEGGSLHPVWMSSAIGIEAVEIFPDTAQDLHIISREGEETVWFWDYWGLTLRD